MGEALDKVRKQEYGRLTGSDRKFNSSSVHPGPEARAAFAPGESEARGPSRTQDPTGRQQAVEHGLHPERVLPPALGRQPRGVGPALL
jgi:hypothetical protein